MNATAGAFLVAGALVIVAVLIVRRIRRVLHRSAVQWMRSPGSLIAHAIPMSELRVEPVEVEALARCARWPLAELVVDAEAERCVPCLRTVEWAVRHHR